MGRFSGVVGGANRFICWPGMPGADVGVAGGLALAPKLNGAEPLFKEGAGLPKLIDGVGFPALLPNVNGLLAALIPLPCGDVMPPKANGALALPLVALLLLAALLAPNEKPPGLVCCWLCADTADTALANRFPLGFVALLGVALPLPNVKSF